VNPFERLGLPVRPWLDPVEVRDAYRHRAVEVHPDGRSGDAREMGELNEAARLLASHRYRLESLLRAHGHKPAPVQALSQELADFLMEAGMAVREIDQILHKHLMAGSALEKAMLAGDLHAMITKVQGLQQRRIWLEEEAVGALRTLESRWRQDAPDFTMAEQLQQRFAYLDRCREQLEERFLRLAEA
jgi:curved DNA-binding protein CbpA